MVDIVSYVRYIALNDVVDSGVYTSAAGDLLATDRGQQRNTVVYIGDETQLRPYSFDMTRVRIVFLFVAETTIESSMSKLRSRGKSMPRLVRREQSAR